jgi:hypothetical protein
VFFLHFFIFFVVEAEADEVPCRLLEVVRFASFCIPQAFPILSIFEQASTSPDHDAISRLSSASESPSPNSSTSHSFRSFHSPLNLCFLRADSAASPLPKVEPPG